MLGLATQDGHRGVRLPCSWPRFSGVLVEIYRQRDPSGGFRYVLLQTACATGNQLLRFTSKDRELVYAALARELGALSG